MSEEHSAPSAPSVGEDVTTQGRDTPTVLWLINPWEGNYKSYIAPMCVGARVAVYSGRGVPNLAGATKQYKLIVTTRKDVLRRLTGEDSSCFTYAGSTFTHKGSRFLVVDTVTQAPYDVPYRLLTSQYIAKLTKPHLFPKQDKLKYSHVGSSTNEVLAVGAKLEALSSRSIACAVDIETVPHEGDRGDATNIITMCGFTYISKELTLSTYVITLENEELFELMRKLLALPVPKIMHGGRYDCTQLVNWGLPPANYTFDTMVLFHSWFHDFRKTLAHVTAFCVMDSKYWKEGRKATSEFDKVQYNARDVYYTALSFIFLMRQAPTWAKEAARYKMRRGQHAVKYGLRGMNTSSELREQMDTQATSYRDSKLQELRASLGAQDYNPNSPKQTLQLLSILAGNKMKVSSSSAEVLERVSKLSTFNLVIVELIIEVRRANKLINTYIHCELTPNGRLLYGLNVLGTVSDRWASNTSDLWAQPTLGARGQKLKNSPSLGQAVMVFTRNTEEGDPLPSARGFVVPDEGMILGSCDLPQSESRFTGYISQDQNLIDAVESHLDFHKTNASKFFGLGYDEITKPLRQLSKPVNHGANYNMGAFVLLQTMGVEKVVMAQKLLKLDPSWLPIRVTEYLLEQFKEAYPRIKGSKAIALADSWYGELIKEVLTTGRLVSLWGWTKQVFGDPSKDKLVMNNCVSAKPQNMSAEYLHKGLDTLEREYTNEGEFEILVPIHDEILFQCKPELKEQVSKWVVDALTQEYELNGRHFTITPDAPQFGNIWTEIH